MRNRRLGLRKILVAAIAMVLVFSTCSGDESDIEISSITSSTAAPVTSSSPPLAPSTTPSTTGTISPGLLAAGIGETVLVVGDDGVYQISAEGDVTLLVAGRVAYAVDDTQGGLLFQVDRDATGTTITVGRPLSGGSPEAPRHRRNC